MSSRPARTMRAALAPLVVLVLAGSGLLTACGVPGSTRPVVVGDAPKLGTRSDSNPNPPPGPRGAGTPQELVKRFLAAAAWGNEVTEDRPRAFDDAVDKVRQFIVDDQKQLWQPLDKGTLTVVRVVSTATPLPPASGGVVTLMLQRTGLLGDNGKLEPIFERPYPQEFIVEPSTDGELRIRKPPDHLLLSDEALRDWYDVHPIYFWDKDGSTLVPDLRYLAQSVPEAKRPNELTKWVLEGPSAWLTSAVYPPAKGIELQDKLFFEGPLLVVNLAPKAAGIPSQVLGHFLDQLRWSLRPYDGSMDLRIGGQPPKQKIDGSTDTYLAANPSGPPGPAEPEAFFVVGGKVQPLRSSIDPNLPVLAAEQNSGVVSAAITRDKKAGALVRRAGARLELWVGTFQGELNPATYIKTDLVATSMSRPVWLSRPSRRVLVAADGKLVDVSPDGSVHPVDTPGLGPITAFAVAPDGRRIALVSGVRVEMGVLFFDANRLLRVVLPPVSTRIAGTPGGFSISGVGWSREDWIVVAGSAAGGGVLVEVTVDGARAEPFNLPTLAGITVTGVVAYPQSPVNGSPGFIMIEAKDGVYKVFSRDLSLQQPGSPHPSPSAKPPGPPPAVTAPFFLD